MQKHVCPRCGAENYTASRIKIPPCHNCGHDFNSPYINDVTKDCEKSREENKKE